MAKIYVADASAELAHRVRDVTGVPTGFLPFAADERLFGTRAGSRRAYEHDFGFSGGWNRLSSRYAMRREVLSAASLARLSTLTYDDTHTPTRLFLPPAALPWLQYADAISSTKIWLATTEGAHLGPRFYEILLSGRAMLLCNRQPDAYAPLGIVEGVHAAMFNSTSEFEATLRYYLSHEGERRAVVSAGRQLALARHTWSTRARDLVLDLPHAACHRRATAAVDAKRV